MPKGIFTCAGLGTANNVMRFIGRRSGCRVLDNVSTVMSSGGTIYYTITYECDDESDIDFIEENASSVKGGGKTKRRRGTHGRTKKYRK
jgi:hypothetical protein